MLDFVGTFLVTRFVIEWYNFVSSIVRRGTCNCQKHTNNTRCLGLLSLANLLAGYTHKRQ